MVWGCFSKQYVSQVAIMQRGLDVQKYSAVLKNILFLIAYFNNRNGGKKTSRLCEMGHGFTQHCRQDSGYSRTGFVSHHGPLFLLNLSHQRTSALL